MFRARPTQTKWSNFVGDFSGDLMKCWLDGKFFVQPFSMKSFGLLFWSQILRKFRRDESNFFSLLLDEWRGAT